MAIQTNRAIATTILEHRLAVLKNKENANRAHVHKDGHYKIREICSAEVWITGAEWPVAVYEYGDWPCDRDAKSHQEPGRSAGELDIRKKRKTTQESAHDDLRIRERERKREETYSSHNTNAMLSSSISRSSSIARSTWAAEGGCGI
jgi:hypothetical protein